MTINYLAPKHKPSTRHVGDIVYTKKSAGSKGYTFFWTAGIVEVKAAMFFYIEAIEGKTHFLVHNF